MASRPGYRPFFWIHFGGYGGCNLRHITGLSVEFIDGLCGLEFHYDTDHREEELHRHKLGRYTENYRTHGKKDFKINGAGGEIIEAVEIDLQLYSQAQTNYMPGKLNNIKV